MIYFTGTKRITLVHFHSYHYKRCFWAHWFTYNCRVHNDCFICKIHFLLFMLLILLCGWELQSHDAEKNKARLQHISSAAADRDNYSDVPGEIRFMTRFVDCVAGLIVLFIFLYDGHLNSILWAQTIIRHFCLGLNT